VHRFGSLDLLVNAAGVIGNGGIQDLTTAEEWKRVMESNLESVFLLTARRRPS
jgi:NAD(P)-dependent dehydrogenase (short-subunit alcohol dehydrogenase family)